jgi:hypothetical protein
MSVARRTKLWVAGGLRSKPRPQKRTWVAGGLRSKPRLAVLLPLLLIMGCGDGKPPRYPVSGVVTLDGRPVGEGAHVIFHPQGETSPDVPKPQALADASGHFQLSTLASGDGAPAGTYAVTVTLQQEQRSGEEITRSGPHLLPLVYAKKETTPLSVVVTSGKNEPRLELLSKPR